MVRTRSQTLERTLYDTDDSENDPDYVPEEDDEYISEEYYSEEEEEEEPEARDYPFSMTRADIRLIKSKKNPYSDKDETLNCESVQKFIKACAHLRIPLYVKFWSRKSMSIKKYYGVPYFTNPMLPTGHPGVEYPSFLFEYNGIHHLVLWAVEEGETHHRWIRCRQQYHNGLQYYPRITANGYSNKATTIMDCIEQEVEVPIITRSKTRAAKSSGNTKSRSSNTRNRSDGGGSSARGIQTRSSRIKMLEGGSTAQYRKTRSSGIRTLEGGSARSSTAPNRTQLDSDIRDPSSRQTRSSGTRGGSARSSRANRNQAVPQRPPQRRSRPSRTQMNLRSSAKTLRSGRKF